MKVILSRKGFDSVAGGYPSPILPDGTLLTLPIPDQKSDILYSKLFFENKSYHDLMSDLGISMLSDNTKTKKPLTALSAAHLDPDLSKNLRSRKNGWRGIFGQAGAAQTHLSNHQVQQGDLFLFFGWFRKTIVSGNTIKYDPADRSGRHIIFGYLQIDEIIPVSDTNELVTWGQDHPHVINRADYPKNNTLYIGKKELDFLGGFPGFGNFSYSASRVLTKVGMTNRSCWNLPAEFRKTEISYHQAKNWKSTHFQSVGRGQEFVIRPASVIKNWIMKVFS